MDKTRFLVDGRVVDPSMNEITFGTEITHIEPKSMEVLTYLFDRPGEVVTREELQDRIWPEVTVGQDSITNAIIKIRKAFGDDARNPSVIATVPKRGYKLIARVEVALASEGLKNGSIGITTKTKTVSLFFGAVGVAATVIVGLAIFWLFIKPNASVDEGIAYVPIDPQIERPAIAIAPFTNLSNDPEHAYLATGVADSILTDLSRLSELVVMRLAKSATTNGETAAVRYVFEGGVLRSGSRIRIDTRLIDAATGEILWSNRFDRPFSDLMRVEDEIQNAIIENLATEIGSVEFSKIASGYTDSIDAYDLFLKGQQALLPRDETSNRRARDLYQQAIEHDPQFARAYAGLALTYAADSRNNWVEDRDYALRRALEMATSALEIAPDLPEQYWVIAYVNTQNRQLEAAEIALNRALELRPNYADALALLGGINTYAGNPKETITLIRQAMHLEPAAGYLYFMLIGRAYYFLDDFEQAQINLNESLVRNSSNIETRLYIAASFVQQDKLDDAAWEIEEINAVEPDFLLRNWLATYPMLDQDQLTKFTSDLRDAGL